MERSPFSRIYYYAQPVKKFSVFCGTEDSSLWSQEFPCTYPEPDYPILTPKPCPPNIILILSSQGLGLPTLGPMTSIITRRWHGGNKKRFEILIEKPERKRPLRRPRPWKRPLSFRISIKISNQALEAASFFQAFQSKFRTASYFPHVTFGLLCLSLDPRFAGSNPTEDDGFIRVIKIRSTTSFGGKVKPSVHGIRFYGMLKTRTVWKR
jgi:hypothetical protein